MDKNAIKKYAVWARRELISRVSQKAQQFGITEKSIVDAAADSVNDHLLTADEKKQRQALIAQVRREGFEQVMEEVAYTWFNRFSALRFMEVNGYLPTRVRVFTDENGAFKPQILAEAIHLELGGLDMKKVFAYKEASNNDELYKYLLITQCNALSAVLPGMFQRIADYTELLFPDNLLRDGSVLEQMITLIPEADWKDQVQIIGWLYQYYNTEPKDKVFADLKKNIKITKENIPAATQLFTPDWIVRYMVENSLGRLWIEGHSESKSQLLPSKDEQDAFIAGERDVNDVKWHYYLEEAKQTPEVQVQLDKIREEYKALKPEQIRCIDPCMGSGHILVYMFDVLMQIYASCGYSDRDAVRSIIENNLYGLDIDDRAAQLAYFSVMMKARQYDSRFFTRGIAPNIYAIRESNGLSADMVDCFVGGDAKLKKDMASLLTEMRDAREYGSILNITPVDFDAICARFDALYDEISIFNQSVFNDLLPFVRVAQTLAQKYSVVCTNPPYMGSGGMGAKLGEYVKKYYPDSKSDLFAVFIERCGQMTAQNCYQAMITQHAWMFLSSFEKLRAKLLQMDTVNMAHLGARAFDEIGGEVVQTTSFVLRKSHMQGCKGVYCRLIEPTTQNGKEDMFLAGENRYESAQDNFSKIPGSPIAYWVSKTISTCMMKEDNLKSLGRVTLGMRTGDNERFLHLWYEINNTMFQSNACSADDALNSKKKWFPYNKGGEYRKWYGNTESVVNWENNGFEIKENTRKVYPQLGDNLGWKITSEDKYFHRGIAWSRISSTNFGVRLCENNLIFDTNAPMFFPKNEEWLEYIAGFMCSKIASTILSALNPTLTFQVVDIGNLPIKFEENKKSEVEVLVENNFSMAKLDWDSFETSWDFKRHPLLLYFVSIHGDRPAGSGGQLYHTHKEIGDDRHIEVDEGYPTHAKLRDSFALWQRACNDRFDQLKANEEELNRIFIDIYNLQDELTPEVEDKDVTVRLADKKRDIRSLISYAVGCMFGRYSLDVEGLAYAGGEWDASKYATFPADRDNIIPICDDEYFEDDITGRFVKFIETVYGKETLDENLHFISDALGGSGQPKDVIRSYFLNDFYADHLKIYQKRPIYWLFDSGKKNGFKALIYMHRYAPDTLARMRTDYVHEQQARYHTALADLEQRVSGASGSERVKLTKQLNKLQEQIAEIRTFEEKIHHLADRMIRIDLDDGVKHNYEIFGDVLAKIK